MRRKISLFTLCVLLLIGAVGNYYTISNPPQKLTTYYRTHAYDNIPDRETDVPAALMALIGINLSVALASGVVLIAGGVVFRRNDASADSPDPLEAQVALKFTIDAIVKAIRGARQQAAIETAERQADNPSFSKLDQFLSQHLHDQGVKWSELVRQWGEGETTQVTVKKLIVESLSRMSPDMQEKIEAAIWSRFNERLQAARKSEVEELLRQAKDKRIVNAATDLTKRIFRAIYLGASENDAVWQTVANILGSPERPDDQFVYGMRHLGGNGVKKNPVEAVKWFRKSAEQGYSQAQYYMGVCYETGKGVPLDAAQSVAWYRKAADQGNPAAQVSLGFDYLFGKGIEKDVAAAFAWFTKAADQGNAHAEFYLGYCYMNGAGVKSNAIEAAKLYRLAADKGHAEAQWQLGNCYAYATGIKSDPKEATKWKRKAAKQGFRRP
jgi:TPR repeat protein